MEGVTSWKAKKSSKEQLIEQVKKEREEEQRIVEKYLAKKCLVALKKGILM